MIALLLGLAAAGDFDHSYAELDAFYDGAVGKAFDYGALAKRRDHLDKAIAAIESADVSGWTADQKLALYVNGYNAHTLATVLDAMPIASIMELDDKKVWDTRKFTVAGESFTLNELENTRIRTAGDARIHAAVNCASVGCPPLSEEPLRAASADAQLTEATRAWASHNAFRIEGSTIHLSQVFNWYASDFEKYVEGDIPGIDGKEEAALWFLDDFVDEATKKKLHSGELKATWTEYDWALNAR